MEGRPLKEESDEQLVAAARRGDPAAYEVLVTRHQQTAFRVAWLIAGNAADAEEAAQNGFVKAFYALDRFRAGSPFRPWLLAIVANEARNAARSARRRESLRARASGDRPPADAAPSPDEAVLARARRNELLAALGRLGERDRAALSCRYLLDLTEAETAAALGWARGTVKSRVHRALWRLRAEMARGGEEGTTP